MTSSPADTARLLNRLQFFGLIVFFVFLFPGMSTAEYKLIEFPSADTIHLSVGQTRILKSDEPITFTNFRIVVENPKIAKADVLPFVPDECINAPDSPDKAEDCFKDPITRDMYVENNFINEIYLTGQSVGNTNLILFQDKRVIGAYRLEVGYDVTGLKRKLHALLPEETDLKILTTHETVTLAGKVSNLANMSIVMDVAKAYFPEEKIKNMVQVGGVHQVMLAVRIAEMQRTLGRRLGINFSYTRGRDFALSLLAGLTEANITENALETTFSSAVNALFKVHRGSADWTFFLDALKSEGVVKILAEPNLISLSGKTAEFNVGGQFPIPRIASTSGNYESVAIDWKTYGIGLRFTPIVLDENRISLEIVSEVTDIDTTNAVQLSGFFIPGVTGRTASTLVELGDGKSFAIAGLLRENVRNAYSKFPVLGDIPILGALFRSSEFQKNETELVIIVTPHIVKPLDSEEQLLPTDFYVEPDDSEFYIMGMMEGQAEEAVLSESGKMDGSFGHEVPFPD